MAGFLRTNRPTDSFALLTGNHHRHLTSSSEIPSEADSLSLSDLVHGFFEEDSDESVFDESDWDRVDSVDECADPAENAHMWRSLCLALANNADPYRITLLAHVLEAAENFAFLRERNVSAFRRSVAAFLKEMGHDAAVCRTAWESGGGVTAGSHEFIDVAARSGSRYFVDLDFRAQFEIARPTRQFSEVLSSVPGMFVGGATELKRVVSLVCDEARRCFMSRGLSVPPWRKTRFMQNKWFKPCRRTAIPVQGNQVPSPIRVTAVNGVSCRLVGFDDVVLETRRGFVRIR